jgi:hypothetical protein
MKEFIIVCSDDKEYKEKYKKTKTTESINHTEIINKLEGNDIYQVKPDPKVIKFFIISKINKAMKNNKIDKIYYRVDEINLELIESLNLIIHTYSEDIDIKIISNKPFNITDIKTNFEKIKII